MATIFMSVAGEGRGHATRAAALVEVLRARHHIRLFAPGSAYDLLAPIFRGSEVTVRRIPGIRNQYNARRKLDYLRMARHAARYFRALPRLVDALRAEMDAFSPDLAVSDFEPALPRAAHQSGLPFMTVDHQHFLVASDLSGLPASLRLHALSMGLAIPLVYRHRPCRRVLSSFFRPSLRPGYRDVEQVGPCLRAEVRTAQPSDGEHIVVYLRRFASPTLLEALERLSRPVFVYGLGPREPQGAVRFRAVDAHAFIRDLATAAALVTTAGNQIVGEALHLGKPVLAMPEAWNFEQAINAHFLVASGAGEAHPLDGIGLRELERFIERVPELASKAKHASSDGTLAAAQAIERELLVGSPREGSSRPTRLPLHLPSGGGRPGRPDDPTLEVR